MRIWILTILILQGCVHTTKTDSGQIVKRWFNADSQSMTAYDFDRARAFYIRERHKRFGDGHLVEKYTSVITVELRAEIPVADGKGGTAKVAGYLINGRKFLLATKDVEPTKNGVPYTIGTSAYWHEMTHLYLLNRYGNGDDAGHEKPPGPWTKEDTEFIEDLRKMWEEENEGHVVGGE